MLSSRNNVIPLFPSGSPNTGLEVNPFDNKLEAAKITEEAAYKNLFERLNLPSSDAAKLLEAEAALSAQAGVRSARTGSDTDKAWYKGTKHEGVCKAVDKEIPGAALLSLVLPDGWNPAKQKV